MQLAIYVAASVAGLIALVVVAILIGASQYNRAIADEVDQ